MSQAEVYTDLHGVLGLAQQQGYPTSDENNEGMPRNSKHDITF
jgi:hypothetical protein